MMPDFKKIYKFSNLDEGFELCDANDPRISESNKNWKAISVGKLQVQIKSLNTDYKNVNKKRPSEFKYSCETNAMNCVLGGRTLNPFF